MSLTVGVFESVFFRGYLQGRLEASFGRASAVVLASLPYGAYHIGYGMGISEVAFLFGLGLIYAVAYGLCGNLIVLWPLMTPMESFFAQLDSGELVGQLPWAAILGFGDVLALMVAALVLARRRLRHRPSYQRRRNTPPAISPREGGRESNPPDPSRGHIGFEVRARAS